MLKSQISNLKSQKKTKSRQLMAYLLKKLTANRPPRLASGEAGYTLNASSGFTLVELLAVMIVLMSIGVIVTSILYSSLRGTNKTNAITNLRQNGGGALAQMSKMIRDAKQLNTPFPCVLPPSPTPSPTYSSITITSYDNGQTTFACTGTTITSNSASLLDTTSIASPTSCYFTCSQTTSSDYPTIGISFGLMQKTLGANFFENTASSTAILFQTSINMRNLDR